MSKYVFTNPEHTLVRCLDDGSTFELPRHTHPSNIAGHAAERWRSEGCPSRRRTKRRSPFACLMTSRAARAVAQATTGGRDAGNSV
jgi:hypothetical protein